MRAFATGRARHLGAALGLGLLAALPPASAWPADADPRLARLDAQLEQLRKLVAVPGLSAAVVRDQQVAWAKGFGFADVAGRVPAAPDTPYRIASLTKPFAATLILQLVEQGKVGLDDPMAKYAPAFPGDGVKVRHVLSHTSEGTPGANYRYNGNRFASLDAVIEKASGESFRQRLARVVLGPLGMADSVPGQDVLDRPNPLRDGLGPDDRSRYERALKRLAKSYTLYGAEELVPSGYPPRGISSAAGLVSTATDLARFDAAVDRHQFLKPETQRLAWTPAVSNDGRTLPYALGWFVQDHTGLRLAWHYGYWPTFSALILKVPERNVSLILLANSDGLSAPFSLGAGDVLNSPFAQTFLRLFVTEPALGRPTPDPDWAVRPEEFAAWATRAGGPAGYAYDREAAARAAAQRYRDARRARERAVARLDPKLYDAYAGVYEQSPGVTYTVTRDGDRLLGRAGERDAEELFPEAEGKFFLKTADAQVTFVTGDGGRVTHLVLRQGGRDVRAKKVK
jgi:CubicO group peptidase (beta-lactamase class C family)